MPADVIEQINVLAKASQVGMNFTSMRNEAYKEDEYCDTDEDSDDDSDYDSDDESSDGDDDDYDDLIAGVDMHNSDPPDYNTDETHHNEESNEEEADNDATQDYNEAEGNHDETETAVVNNEAVQEAPSLPRHLKQITDHNGILPPTLQSRTRQQAQETGESLLMGADTEKWTVVDTMTKKQRKFRKQLQIRLLKREKKKKRRKDSETN
jgi:hypothetical protein